MKWTNEQLQAIEKEGSNILVAAAAGSGKTAVLVERIINKIINQNIDIDKILVVTFTNAAASEMKQRILEALYKKAEEAPENDNIQRQIILLNKANISTLHSFCLDVIRNNFFEADISPNFRVGEISEIELLKQDTLEDMFEELYEENNEEFIMLLDTYTDYKGDEPLKEVILKIYEFIQSKPFPKKWINEVVEKYNININQDFAKTTWGQVLLNEVESRINDAIIGLENIAKRLIAPELSKCQLIINEDIISIKELLKHFENWDILMQKIENLEFSRWSTNKNVMVDLQKECNDSRGKIRNKLKENLSNIFVDTSTGINEDILFMYNILTPLKKLVLKFSDSFSQKKKEKNIVDFNDIEHFALKLLINENEDGSYTKTDVAKMYTEKFNEVAVDEYQDSNNVQEYILKAVSNGNNVFMVGDVKQSIYKFRGGKPELFLKKYEKYALDESNKDGLKIKLFNNFRSRGNILNLINLIFENIMSKSLGEIEYNEEEYLNLLNKEETENLVGKSELHIIDLKEQNEEYDEDMENSHEEGEIIENIMLEAKFVAQKIEELFKSNLKVYDRKKENYRNLQYKDIVLLLRTTKNISPVFEKELSDYGFNVFSDTSSEYLDSTEIQTIMAILKIIDNPDNDIALVTVLRNILNVSENELIEIRLIDRNCSFYKLLLKRDELQNEELKNKIDDFFKTLENWQESAEYLPLDELIWKIYLDTGYYTKVILMPNGILKQANLKMLFQRAKEYENSSFKGLFSFIKFIDKLRTNNGDLGSAKLIGENANVIRIMSIHKSKGLEFPIVFLSNTAKKFNYTDLYQELLLDDDLGIGTKYINYDKKVKYNLVTKEAIKCKAKKEIISEEMRILYVALTRAKEKLIITGTSKDFEKELKEKKELLENLRSKKIPTNIVERYSSYLEWLELVTINNKEEVKDSIDVINHEKLEVMKNCKEIQKSNNLTEILNKPVINKELKEISDKFNYKYKHINSTKIQGKTSVSNIKSKEKEINKKIPIPKFLLETEKIAPAEKGTLMHLCLQKLNFEEDYNEEKIENLLQKLIRNRIISEMQAKEISIEKVVHFTKSKLVQQIKQAKTYKKEKSIYMELSAKEVYGVDTDEKILIQGVIDLYFINKNDEIILVDYKTDYVKEEGELVKKYITQLELYKNALEKAENKKVIEMYIYSTYLGKEINVK